MSVLVTVKDGTGGNRSYGSGATGRSRLITMSSGEMVKTFSAFPNQAESNRFA
jgi:hypothetical protein